MTQHLRTPCGLCHGTRLLPRWSGVGSVLCPWCCTPEDAHGPGVVKREIVEALREQLARAA